MTGPRQNDAYVARRVVGSANLIPVRQFCCGYTVMTCSQQCTGMNLDGNWYLIPLLLATVELHLEADKVLNCFQPKQIDTIENYATFETTIVSLNGIVARCNSIY